jgi:hypothetical protein
MKCRRICRELLWLARFGEFGPSSAPHLDHLSRCSGCRDEVGFDRALVQQLRLALAERIANDEPSPSAWDAILARAQAPESTGLAAFVRGHAVWLAVRLRTATAVSAIALAGIIATSTQVSVTHPEAGSAETEVRRSAAGELFERQPLVPRPRTTATPVIYVPATSPADPEAAFLISATRSLAPAPAEEEPATETTIESEVSIGAAVSRLTPADSGGSPPADERRVVTDRPEVPVGEPY